MTNEIDSAELKRQLSYDPDTGVFMWLEPTKFRPDRKGKIAGTITDKGYIKIKIGGRNYLAHRLAWLHETGRWPSDEIDHVNRRRDDNRIENLRAVSHAENQLNRSNNRRIYCLGRALTISEWSAETGLSPATIRSRIERGWTAQSAISRAA